MFPNYNKRNLYGSWFAKKEGADELKWSKKITIRKEERRKIVEFSGNLRKDWATSLISHFMVQ